MDRILISNRRYYDDFSLNYERQRHGGYHALIDELEADLVGRYCKNAKVLEAGCGSGILLSLVKRYTSRVFGLDISDKMLKMAKDRGFSCAQGDICALPFKDGVFDVVYSFKVLAHVQNIKEAIIEMRRVSKKNGYLILEFYNPYSLRRLIKAIKRPSRISQGLYDCNVFVRFDSLKRIKNILPEDMKIEFIRGIRIFTPFALIYKIPLLNRFFDSLERRFCDSYFKYFAGFLIVVLK